MKIRSLEELDYYEILNIPRTVSPADLLRAYLMAVATYRPEGLHLQPAHRRRAAADAGPRR
jgi:curved DNA-binding protein CbpA